MEHLTTVLEILAGALIVFGVWQVCIPAAYVVAGLCVLGISYALERSREPKAPKP